MNNYIEAIYGSYSGYFNYLLNEILNPGFHNYFYWLIGISIIIWLLEMLFPWRKNQNIFRKDFFLDLFYMFFNFFLFSLVVYNALSNVAVMAFSDFLAIFGIKNLIAINLASLPTWVQLVSLFLIRDFIQWNIHRLLHKVPWMWEVHKVHHSIEEMGFAGHLRYHWMENVIYRSIEYLPLAMIGFGIDDFFMVHIFSLVIGHLNHSNLYLPLGPLKYIFNNPQMHLWHHAEDLPKDRKTGVNFGISLSLWDYLFGLNYIPNEIPETKLGFSDIAQYPKTFWNQLTYTWWKKK